MNFLKMSDLASVYAQMINCFFKRYKILWYYLLFSDYGFEYNIGFRKTLSSNKLRMPKYKYLALRDFGLSRLESFYYLCWYFHENFWKLIKKDSV